MTKYEKVESYFQGLGDQVICEPFCVPKNTVHNLKELFLSKRSEIMNLESYNFDQFPDGTANRLHLYNIFKWTNSSVFELKQIISSYLHSTFPEFHKKMWITGWFNSLEKDQRLGWHSHEEDAQAFLSGVLFLTEQSAKLIFSVNNCPIMFIEDCSGHVCLFSTNVKHATEVAKSSRLSIAFDIQIGEKKSELWVPLFPLQSSPVDLKQSFVSKNLIDTRPALFSFKLVLSDFFHRVKLWFLLRKKIKMLKKKDPHIYR